jgi:hypothetical protein
MARTAEHCGCWLVHERRAVRSHPDHPAMPQNFLACDRDQELLMPPNLREWLPEDHFAWFVLAAVDEMDLALLHKPVEIASGGVCATASDVSRSGHCSPAYAGPTASMASARLP